jgi:hypothetical protein
VILTPEASVFGSQRHWRSQCRNQSDALKMLSTIFFVTLLLGLLLVSTVSWALSLNLGLRWAKVPDVTTRHLLLATVLVFGLPLLLTILFLYVTRSVDAPIVVLVAAQIVTAVIVPCLVIARVFKTRFIRAVQVWLPTLLAPVPCVVIVLFVLRPFLYGAFVLPTNSMAPTLIGTHWRGSCPECGSPNYCTPVDSF